PGSARRDAVRLADAVGALDRVLAVRAGDAHAAAGHDQGRNDRDDRRAGRENGAQGVGLLRFWSAAELGPPPPTPGLPAALERSGSGRPIALAGEIARRSPPRSRR